MKILLISLLFSLPSWAKIYTFKIDVKQKRGDIKSHDQYEIHSKLGKKLFLKSDNQKVVILPTHFDDGIDGEAIHYQTKISEGRKVIASPEMISILGDESVIESRDMKTGDSFSLTIKSSVTN